MSNIDYFKDYKYGNDYQSEFKDNYGQKGRYLDEYHDDERYNSRNSRERELQEINQNEFNDNNDYNEERRDIHLKNEIPVYLRTGPLENRICTDCFCLVIFFIFTIWSFLLSGYAIYYANPKSLDSPYDSDRNFFIFFFF